MRVALYPRVSGHEQEDNYSIPEQIKRMTAYCEARGWMIYKIYTDAGFTGSNLNRPGLQMMIKDAEKKNIDMVLVYKLDRLSRSQKDTLYLIEDVFDKHDVYFTSITENFDTSTPTGKAFLGILAVFAQFEREQIRERTMIGKDSRAREGLWHGSAQKPTGYDYVNGELIINEYEAMQINEAAELFLKGTPFRTIERIFKEKGYKRKGNDWRTKNLREILSNPLYIGMIRHRDKVYQGQHKPILSVDTFEEMQTLLNARKEQWSPIIQAKHKSLLGGMLFCKHCGGRFARQSGNPRNRTAYYCCYSRSKKIRSMIKDPNCKNKYHRADVLEPFILGEISKLALDVEHIQGVRDSKPVNDVSNKITMINNEIESIDSQISNLMDLYSLNQMPLDVISRKVTALNDTKTKLQKELDSMNIPTDEEALSNDEIKNLAELLNDESLELDDKRAIIQALIYYIELDNDDVIIHWKF